MREPWYKRNPELAKEISADLRVAHPNLHLFIHTDGMAEVRGTYAILSPQGKLLDRFRVSIELPHDYPRALPIVREVGRRIPWRQDFHVEPDGKACVLLPDDRWRCFPEGKPFAHFLDGPVHDFFLGQSLVALGEEWPFGEWSHGPRGVLEYYQGLLETDHDGTVHRFLRILSKLNLKQHCECPCGSGRKIRKCCQKRVADLRRKIPPAVARKACERLGLTRRFGGIV